MGFIRFIQLLLVIAGFIVPLAGLAEIKHDEPKQGEKKKAEVKAELLVQLEKVGLKLPEWIEKYTETILGLLIDLVVFIMDKTGFFDKLKDLPEA